MPTEGDARALAVVEQATVAVAPGPGRPHLPSGVEDDAAGAVRYTKGSKRNARRRWWPTPGT